MIDRIRPTLEKVVTWGSMIFAPLAFLCAAAFIFGGAYVQDYYFPDWYPAWLVYALAAIVLAAFFSLCTWTIFGRRNGIRLYVQALLLVWFIDITLTSSFQILTGLGYA